MHFELNLHAVWVRTAPLLPVKCLHNKLRKAFNSSRLWRLLYIVCLVDLCCEEKTFLNDLQSRKGDALKTSMN